MKTLSKMVSVAALLILGAAQTGFAQNQTDEVLALDFDLTVISQASSPTTTAGVLTDVQVTKITSRTIIEELAVAMGTTFSRHATLVALAPTNALSDWDVQIQDGTNAVDVSGFLLHQEGFPTVSGSWLQGPQAGIVDYSVDTFMLQDFGVTLSEHFNVSGITTVSSTTVTNHKGVVVSVQDTVTAHVSGTGDIQGNPTVIHGSITAQGVGTVTVETGPSPTS